MKNKERQRGRLKYVEPLHRGVELHQLHLPVAEGALAGSGRRGAAGREEGGLSSHPSRTLPAPAESSCATRGPLP